VVLTFYRTSSVEEGRESFCRGASKGASWPAPSPGLLLWVHATQWDVTLQAPDVVTLGRTALNTESSGRADGRRKWKYQPQLSTDGTHK